jgi:hypothetical protein
MERQSTKHGPRLDEELERETESLVRGAPVEARSDEGREKEPLADDELPSDPVLARRELSRHLTLSVFPAQRQELLEEARRNQAPGPVLALLEALPPEARFGTVHEVFDALLHGGHAEALGVEPASDALELEERDEARRQPSD